jgi:hypothetical protein
MSSDPGTAMTVSQGGQVALFGQTPQEQIQRASEMARSLQQVVRSAGLAVNLGGRQYLQFEGWQTLGAFFQCTAVVEWARPVEVDGAKGYEARAVVKTSDGREIGASEGMCLDNERNWSGKPSYALRSMSQTRACAKALRSVFSHIVVLAGFQASPAEEMTGFVGEGPPQAHRPPQTNQGPQGGQGQGRGQAPMTQPQRGKIWHLCQDAGLSRDDSKAFVDSLQIQTVAQASGVIENFNSLLAQWRGDPVPADAEPVFDDDVPF